MRALRRLEALSRWFLPPVVDDEDRLRRLRIALVMALGLTILVPLVAIYELSTGDQHRLTEDCAHFASGVIVLVMIRLGVSTTVLGHALALSVVGPALLVLLPTRGQLDASALGLSVAPVAAMLVSGSRSGWFWVVVSLLGHGLLYAHGETVLQREWCLGLAAMGVGLAVVMQIFETTLVRQVRELEQARDEAEVATRAIPLFGCPKW